MQFEVPMKGTLCTSELGYILDMYVYCQICISILSSHFSSDLKSLHSKYNVQVYFLSILHVVNILVVYLYYFNTFWVCIFFFLHVKSTVIYCVCTQEITVYEFTVEYRSFSQNCSTVRSTVSVTVTSNVFRKSQYFAMYCTKHN